MEQSPRLSLSYLAPSQAQKHVTVNETFRRLDQLVQQTVLSRTTSAQPGSPADGDAYILPASPTGTDWAAYAQHSIAAWQDGAWVEIVPAEGWRAWIDDVDELHVYDGSTWSQITAAAQTGAYDLNGEDLTLDADADSYIHVPADDEFSLVLGNVETLNINSAGRAEFKATGTNVVTFRSSFNPTTSAVGVTVQFISEGASGANEILGRFNYWGKDSASVNELYAYFEIIMVDNTAGSEDASFAVTTIAGGSRSRRFEVRQGLFMQGASGGDKGAGTINATAVYDDNTLLTCYVFDQALDGTADLEKWDRKIPDRIFQEGDSGLETERIEVRRHEPLRKFLSRIGAEHDPLTLDGYARHWKEKRHLTSMPNEATYDPVNAPMAAGEWIQRLVETAEIQAVLIEQLNERVKALETAGRGRGSI